MSKENRHKRHGTGGKNENEKENERPKSSLFNATDLKSFEIYRDTLDPAAPQYSKGIPEKAIPTGVVDIDETVKLPTLSVKPEHRHHDSKTKSSLKPNGNNHKEKDHLPPINNKNHHHHNHHSYVIDHTPPDYHYHGHVAHHHHHHRHSHHKHHKHRHHRHEIEVETYDPRWWYLQPNSVHAPKSWRQPEYHFVAPKWYESSSTQTRTSFNIHEPQLTSRKYIDCRCEVCKPSRQAPHGVRWIVNE